MQYGINKILNTMELFTHLLVWIIGIITGIYFIFNLHRSSEEQNKKLINNMNKLDKHGITKNKGKG